MVERCEETPSAPSHGEPVETKLHRIARKARNEPGFKFTSLYHLMDVALLRGCFMRLRGDAAAGIDGMTTGSIRLMAREGQCEEPCALIVPARFCEGRLTTEVWSRYSGTAGKPGGKQRKQTSTCSIGRKPPTRQQIQRGMSLPPEVTDLVQETRDQERVPCHFRRK